MERDALVDGAGAETPVEQAALHRFDGNAAPAGRGLRFPGLRLEEPANPAGRVRQGRGHGVAAMKPEFAGSGRFAAILGPIGH